MTVDEFGEKLKASNERLNTADKALEQVRQAAKNEYMTAEVDGLEMTD